MRTYKIQSGDSFLNPRQVRAMVELRLAQLVLVLFDLILGACFFLFRCHLIPPRLMEFVFVLP
jgi:hypothetical protein